MDDYKTQEALIRLSQQSSPKDALRYYEDHYDVLKDWRYLYASNSDKGSFKLQNQIIDDVVGIKSVFRGNSLWVIDSNMVESDDTVPYLCGVGTYLDSNAASYIYSLAYKDSHKDILRTKLRQLHSLNIDYHNINPYFYLYEAQRHYESKPETIEYSRKTFAAMNALKKIDGPLDAEWSRMYQTYFREQSENEINPLFNQFLDKLQNGLGDVLKFRTTLIELLLLQTKILEMSSSKSPETKLEQFFEFMDEEIEMLIIREVACCADILFRDDFSSLTQKLSGLKQKKDPILFIQNCAWDLYIFRLMDDLSNTHIEPVKPHFYISQLVACDRDIWGIAKLSSLRGMALHTKSSHAQPFMEHDPEQWLEQKIGKSKMDNLHRRFDYSSQQRRLAWISSDNPDLELQHKMARISELTHEKRKELLFYLNS